MKGATALAEACLDEVQALNVADRVSIDWAVSALPKFTALHRAAFAYAHSTASSPSRSTPSPR